MTYPTNKNNLQIIKDYNAQNLTEAVKKIKENLTGILLINEVFPAIQCEGLSMGKPCIFIRTYGCNLRCGFSNPGSSKEDRGCDTKYTWHPEFTENSDKNRYTPEMLLEEISEHKNHNHWIISGGEPLLQDKRFPKLIELYIERYGQKPYIEIETNGTLIPNPLLDMYVGHYNVSLKLENSNATEKTGYEKGEFEYNFNTSERRIKEDAVKYWTKKENAYFKFVVDGKLTVLDEIKELQKEFNIPNSKVWLMPEGNSPEDINKFSLPITEKCQEEGYRFSTRLHILLYGFQRGV